jgi:hypothetical protein
MREAKSEAVKARPRGVKIRPSTPLKRKIGTKTIKMINVAYTMEVRISTDASKTTWSEGLGAGRSRFSRSRRKMFSTSMMASSTTAPMAMARPPRVMELMPMPK